MDMVFYDHGAVLCGLLFLFGYYCLFEPVLALIAFMIGNVSGKECGRDPSEGGDSSAFWASVFLNQGD